MASRLAVSGAGPEREAIATAVDQARWHIALASVLGAVAAGVLILLGLYSEAMGTAMALVLGIPMLLLYLLATPAYLRWSAEAVLSLLHGVLVLTAVSYLLLLADALFGSAGPRLLDEELPLVLIYLPVQLTFIYTYLPTLQAHWYAGIQAVITLLMLLLCASLDPQALHSAAWYWLLGSVLVVTPLCVLLLQLQAELHAGHRRALSRREASIADETARLRAAQSRDPLAGSMNRPGLERALAESICRQPQTEIAFLEVERYEHLRLRLGRQRIRGWLGWLSLQFREAFGDAVCWGRWRSGQILLWHPTMTPELFASSLEFLEELLRRPSGMTGVSVEFRIGRAAASRSAPEEAAAAVEDLVARAEHAAWPERRPGTGSPP